MAASVSDASLLAVADLEVRYGPVAALRGVSLEVGAGEMVAVVGPNGAGKSSLMLAIAGAVPAQAGRIAFRGASIRGASLEDIVRRGIALVPEGRHIFGSLTVEENLRLGITVRADRRAGEADLEAALRTFPILGERRRQPAGRLSGGEQQQLAIARALLGRPALLLLDEPSLGLAPAIIDQVYGLLGTIRAQGVAILVVEQNAARALAAADRTYVLNAGLVRLAGTRAELIGNPAFDAAYFGVAMSGGAAAP
ncbi:MAG TPA: ABC transporter ATP-binding protein [Alphaproteobacteria bacterium]|jgi:branched-chain amino acid transport system ATP-binding protein|nr:ABC transporter ATP-binding protein [Alphaproteobacteria bacterium]